MVPSGQSLPSPFLNSNSAMLGGEKGNNLPSMNFLGSIPNISSIIGPSFPSIDHDPLSDMGFCSNQPQNHHQFDSQSFPQQLSMASLKHDPPPPSKTEQNDQQQQQSMYLQQQQQQILQISRQSSQTAAHMNLLQQQRIFQMQQQQLKAIPLQRGQQQQLPLRVKSVPEVGTCSRRLTQYMYEQRQRPEDNNIEFWRKFVANYFTPNAKKKWCVSMYGSGRHTNGVFPQDVWHCEICNCKSGRGFEATAEVLPRLFKIKYESGTLEELLYVDMPCENTIVTGQIVLDYAKAIQESVFEQLRVVREGQLRIVFSPDLKICSWEFCARRHEELIPRRLLIPQVSQLGAAAQKYQAAAQSAASTLSLPQLQNNCNMFVASARQLAKALDVPLVNDLGYTKRYVRCLQISEVVNSMKDLIDYSRDTSTGPMETLSKFPKRMRTCTTEATTTTSDVNNKGIRHNSPNNGTTNNRTATTTTATTSSSPAQQPTSAPYCYTNGVVGQQQQQQQQMNTVEGGTGEEGQSCVEKIIQEMMMARGARGGGCVRTGGRDHTDAVAAHLLGGGGGPQNGFNFDWKQ